MRILCLVSWPPKGRWLWDYIPGNRDTVDFASITHPADRFPGYGKVLGYYEKFWWLAIKAWPRIRQYDVVVTWEANTGLPLAFLRTLLGPKSPPMLIVNFVLKGRPILDMLPLVRYAARSIDCLTCISDREIAYNSQQLHVPARRFVRLQGPWPDDHAGLEAEIRTGDYIFSAGRSHRDYGTLMRAAAGLPAEVIVNARSFNVAGLTPPPNVRVNPFLSRPEFLKLVREARFAVVPLFAAQHASGESFMMQAIAARKAVVATRTYSTAELIEPGINGLLVPPGDVKAMRSALHSLWEHPETAAAMGSRGRQMYEERWSFPVVARQVHEIVSRLVDAKGRAPDLTGLSSMSSL